MKAHWVLMALVGASTGCGQVQALADDGREKQAAWESKARDQARQMCDASHGEFSDVQVGACIDGSATVTAGATRQEQPCTRGEASSYDSQCLQRDVNGLLYFSDGPSVPYEFLNVGEGLGEGADLIDWNAFFWQPAGNHDFCYHHGDPVYHYTQADCDNQLLDDLVALCSQPASAALPSWFTKDRCTVNAQIVYSSVRAFGQTNYERMATKVDYPPYQPMWQKLGLAEAPNDPSMRGAIDSVL